MDILPGDGGAVKDRWPDSAYDGHLHAQHTALLRASAISPDVATERGYMTIVARRELEERRFSPAQRRPGGLLIPSFNTAGQHVDPAYRPDNPRTVDGKVRRYELPPGTRLYGASSK